MSAKRTGEATNVVRMLVSKQQGVRVALTPSPTSCAFQCQTWAGAGRFHEQCVRRNAIQSCRAGHVVRPDVRDLWLQEGGSVCVKSDGRTFGSHKMLVRATLRKLSSRRTMVTEEKNDAGLVV